MQAHYYCSFVSLSLSLPVAFNYQYLRLIARIASHLYRRVVPVAGAQCRVGVQGGRRVHRAAGIDRHSGFGVGRAPGTGHR